MVGFKEDGALWSNTYLWNQTSVGSKYGYHGDSSYLCEFSVYTGKELSGYTGERLGSRIVKVSYCWDKKNNKKKLYFWTIISHQ